MAAVRENAAERAKANAIHFYHKGTKKEEKCKGRLNRQVAKNAKLKTKVGLH